MPTPTYQGILGKGKVRKGHTVDEFIALAKYYNEMFGLPENLVPAAMMKESEFDHLARSRTGPMGLMQLAGGTRFDTGVLNPYDPEESLMGGAAYYRSMMDNYPKFKIDTLRKLSAMYTEGPGAASRMVTGKIPYNDQANTHYLKIKDALRKINAADDTIADYRELTEVPIQGRPMEIEIPVDNDNYSEGSLEAILSEIGYGEPTGLTLKKYMELPAKARKILEKFKKLYPEPVPSVVELPEKFDPYQDMLNSIDNIDTVPIRW